MQVIETKNAPAAIGPYSQAITANGFLFCSGQLGIDPSKGALISENIEAQAEQALKNIKSILNAAGIDFSDIVKTTIFLTSLDDFKIVNEIYSKELGGHKPSRSTVQVSKLPMGAKIEIECIAAVK